jgi:hypothetical protein
VVPGEDGKQFRARRDAILRGLNATEEEMGETDSTSMPNLHELFAVRKSKLGGFGLFAKKTININTRIPYLGE